MVKENLSKKPASTVISVKETTPDCNGVNTVNAHGDKVKADVTGALAEDMDEKINRIYDEYIHSPDAFNIAIKNMTDEEKIALLRLMEDDCIKSNETEFPSDLLVGYIEDFGTKLFLDFFREVLRLPYCLRQLFTNFELEKVLEILAENELLGFVDLILDEESVIEITESKFLLLIKRLVQYGRLDVIRDNLRAFVSLDNEVYYQHDSVLEALAEVGLLENYKAIFIELAPNETEYIKSINRHL